MKKEYIVIYRSQEHFEVLGWVSAENMEAARVTALSALSTEAGHYDVSDAEIAEYIGPETIYFASKKSV